jgi:SAM-dependent methyltransferase
MPESMVGSSQSHERWSELLGSLAALTPAGPTSVLVDGPADAPDPRPGIVADRLAAALQAAGRPVARLSDPSDQVLPGDQVLPSDQVLLCAGARWRGTRRWNVVIWLRTATDSGHGDADADVVIDLYDPGWPVIRRPWCLTETRAFFAYRAAAWDAKFGDDMPAYATAIAEARLRLGGVVVDAGCGTGRAVPGLRESVGPFGKVLAVDVTPEMLARARPRCEAARAALVLADARRIPLGDGAADAVFAAGLVTHLPDTTAGFRELARITRPGGKLVLFHPSGRAALAARHGRTLRPDDPLALAPLRGLTAASGWRLTAYDDAAERFFAVACRD